jgi:4'-phosphopantetheinyl transferase
LRLPAGEIHLWFAFPGEAGGPHTAASVRPILDDGEKARMARLHFPGGRHLFEVSHSLVRTTLSRYSKIPPEKWRFVKSAHGKPSIDPNLDSPPLSFSLAHTKGLAVVAVTEGTEVGVDVEGRDRRVDAARLISRFFSPEEAAALQEIPSERLRERFFCYWTLKEAYIKARGLGLSLPLDSFSFRLAGEIPFRIGFSGDDRSSGNWRFAVLAPRPQYVAAVGFAPDRPGPVRIRCFDALASDKAAPPASYVVGLSPDVEIA